MRWSVGGLGLRCCRLIGCIAIAFFALTQVATAQEWVYPGALISVRGPSSARASVAEGLREITPKNIRVEKLKRSPLRAQEHPILLLQDRRIRGHGRHQPTIASNPTRNACRRAKMRKFLGGIRGRVSCSANHALFPSRVPNDTSYSQLYSPNPMSLPAAWDLTTGNDDTLAAVIDTGILYSHPDLIDNLWTNPGEVAGDGVDNDGNGYIDDIHGWNAITNSGNANDDQGHGTHCAGIMGARGNNSRGIPGVAWNTKLIAVKFLSSTGSGSTADAIKSVNYVTTLRQRGLPVVVSNNSWGGSGFNLALQTAIQNHEQAGVLFVAAAGNENSNNDAVPKYPANYAVANIISIASTDAANQRSGFSNYGVASVDIAAPGSGIYSTYLANSYAFLSGTSMAAPQVSGIAILMQAACNNSLTYQQLRDGILSTGTVHGHLSSVVATSSIANAFGAVTWALAACGNQTPSPTPTATNTPTSTPTPTVTPTNTPIPSPTPTPTLAPAPPRTCPNVKFCRSRPCTENALRCLSQLTPTPTYTPDDGSSGPIPTATPTDTPSQARIRRPCCLGCRSRRCSASCSLDFCPGAPATATPTPTRETTATATSTPTPTAIPRSTPSWANDPSVPLMIFTSSINLSFTTAYNGVTGGLEAAREFCQQRADAGGIGGSDKEWYPLVSDSTFDAQSLTGTSQSSAPIYDRLGGIIADSRGHLWDSSEDLLKPIDFNEFGAIRHTAAIMTGSTAEGLRYSSNPSDFCLDWTTHSSAEYFHNTGVSNEVDTDWVAEIDHNLCTWTRPVYCIGPASNATATPTSTPADTETPTFTPTPADTDTPTSTPTDTPIPTDTPTATDTPTTTPTPTDTPTSTETPTSTPTDTDTPTETPTATPTDTETPTSTPSPTPTPLPTDTSTPTATPTETPTPTPSWSVPWADSPSQELIVFVSSELFEFSTPYNGIIGGLEAARELCQMRANAAGLGGAGREWFPLLSSSRYDAQSLTGTSPASAPIRNVVGQIIATSRAHLWDRATPLNNPVLYTELGDALATQEIYTGSLANGLRYSSQDTDFCLDWTSNSAGEQFEQRGDSNSVNSSWFATSGRQSCAPARYVYCIGPSDAPTVTPTATPTFTPTALPTNTPTATPTVTITPDGRTCCSNCRSRTCNRWCNPSC